MRDEADGTSRDSPDQSQRRFEGFLSRLLAVTKQEADALLEAERKQKVKKAAQAPTGSHARDATDQEGD